MSEHTDDLRNVNEGDSVTLTTTEGETFDVECTLQQVQHADERTGEVRENHIWIFDGWLSAAITDGLRSSPDDPEFPTYSALWDIDENEGHGYVEDVQIHGEMDHKA